MMQIVCSAYAMMAILYALFFVVVPALADLKADMKEEALRWHNFRRENAGLKPLTWDDELEKMATGWSEALRDKNCPKFSLDPNWGHNPDRGQKGENVYYKKNSVKKMNLTTLPYLASKSWYEDELIDYIYSEEDYLGCDSIQSKVGHLVQMMWAKATKMGCGYSEPPCNTEDGVKRWAYTCNYDKQLILREQMFPAKNFLNLCATEKGNWSTCDASLQKQCLSAKKSGDNRAVIGRYVIVMSFFAYFAIHKLFL